MPISAPQTIVEPALSSDVAECALSIVVPAYNERDRLPRGLRGIVEYLDARGLDGAELIVVDDGSADGTDAVASSILEPTGRPFRVLCNPGNRGKGYSVRRGLLDARGARVLFTDADLSTPIDELGALERALDEGADIAIGSRDVEGARVLRHQVWYRELAGKSFNVAVRALAVSGIRDTQCGFKLFTREAAQTVCAHQTLDRWGFDVELLLLARRLGLRIAEVPVRWINDEDTKVDLVRDGTAMLVDILRIRWRHRHL